MRAFSYFGSLPNLRSCLNSSQLKCRTLLHQSKRSFRQPCCQAQKLKKSEASQAEVAAAAAAKAATPSVTSLQQQLQGEPSPHDAARTLLLLGKRVDLGDDIGQQECAAAASVLADVAALLNDRSEAVAQATAYANNLHPMWKIESTAPPRIQLLTAPELRKASWALTKLKAKLGLEEPELLQGILTQLAFDQE